MFAALLTASGLGGSGLSNNDMCLLIGFGGLTLVTSLLIEKGLWRALGQRCMFRQCVVMAARASRGQAWEEP